jgi:peroxiredoxin
MLKFIFGLFVLSKQTSIPFSKMAHDLPLLNSIKDAKLTKLDEPDVSITASSLWEKQPVMVMVVRRPGCKLCRAQVQFMSQFRDEFARRNIRLLAVSHQEDSVQEFAEKFLGHKEDMFLDKKKDFYRCLGYCMQHQPTFRHSYCLLGMAICAPRATGLCFTTSSGRTFETPGTSRAI